MNKNIKPSEMILNLFFRIESFSNDGDFFIKVIFSGCITLIMKMVN